MAVFWDGVLTNDVRVQNQSPGDPKTGIVVDGKDLGIEIIQSQYGQMGLKVEDVIVGNHYSIYFIQPCEYGGTDFPAYGITGVDIEDAVYGVYVGQSHIGVFATKTKCGLNIGETNYGTYIGTAKISGLYIKKSEKDGINILEALNNGVNVEKANNNGFEIGQANNGFVVGFCKTYGIFIASAEAGDGIHIIEAGMNGCRIEKSKWSGFSIEEAGASGVYIGKAAGHGINIDLANLHGINVSEAGSHGVRVAKTTLDGLRVCEAGRFGLGIRHSGDDGIRVEAADIHGLNIRKANWHGISIGTSGLSGLNIDEAGIHGVYVAKTGSDGLHVKDSGRFGLWIENSEKEFMVAGPNANRKFQIKQSGRIDTVQGCNVPSCTAELIETKEGSIVGYEPGDVLVISDSKDRTVELAKASNSTKVAGVYCEKPGITSSNHPLEDQKPSEIPLAISGIVPCKVKAPIKRGDLLTTSNISGHAMKAPAAPIAGSILGKAFGELNAGNGKIDVLIMLR